MVAHSFVLYYNVFVFMEKKEKKKIHFKRIFYYYTLFLKEWRLYSFLLLFLGILYSLVVSALIPFSLKEITDALEFEKNEQTFFHIQFWFFVLLFGYFSSLSLNGFRSYIIIQTEVGIMKRLHDLSFLLLSRKSYSFFTETFTGGLVAKTNRFVRGFEVVYDAFFWDALGIFLSLIVGISFLFYFSPILGFVFLVWAFFYGATAYFLIQWVIPKRLESASAESLVTARFSDVFSNILTTKMMGREKEECTHFYEKTRNHLEKRKAAWMQAGFFNDLVQSIFIIVFQTGLLGMTLFLWQKGEVGTGIVFVSIFYGLQQANFVYMIAQQFVQVTEALSDADEMIEILDKKEEIKEVKNPQKIHIEKGNISFRGITHTYNEKDGNLVFDNFSLDIKGGEKVALVGKSGSGKTTLTKILLRFMDVKEGGVFIDNIDIKKVSQKDLREKIAYVPQEPALFHRSIYENIAYGNPLATKEEVIQVAKRARAHSFIEKTPLGYETLVGERGVKLSGGERQRIAIARALLKDAPIVVLDEATSALDSESERAIQEAFDELMKGRTTLVIAHRLSTIAHMDRIIVLEEGKIKEIGTHSSLLEKKGDYALLWDTQFGGFLKNT
jgi:ATP-binding cassette, subfamily B, bacterial